MIQGGCEGLDTDDSTSDSFISVHRAYELIVCFFGYVRYQCSPTAPTAPLRSHVRTHVDIIVNAC